MVLEPDREEGEGLHVDAGDLGEAEHRLGARSQGRPLVPTASSSVVHTGATARFAQEVVRSAGLLPDDDLDHLATTIALAVEGTLRSDPMDLEALRVEVEHGRCGRVREQHIHAPPFQPAGHVAQAPLIVCAEVARRVAGEV